MHELERRAVFLRSWFYMGTVNKFQSGEDIRFEIAQVILIAKTTGAAKEKTIKLSDEATVCCAFEPSRTSN